MFEQVEEARAGRGSKVLSEKEISKVNYDENCNMNDYYSCVMCNLKDPSQPLSFLMTAIIHIA